MVFIYDNDGCLIKGDVTEGYLGNYKGIVEHLYSIGKADTSVFPTYDDYNTKYTQDFKLFNTGALEYPLLVAGESQTPYIREYWYTTLRHYLVPKTVEMVREQAKYGEVWILTGSPTLFVDPIREFIPEITRVVGVESGQIITYSTGKIRRILSIIPVEKIQGFTGETWTNDGPLLSYLRNILQWKPELRFIDHGQIDKNTKVNLCRYQITRVRVGKY